MVNLRLQKRLAAAVLKCGRHKIWLDPNEMNEVGMANTRTAVRKLIRDGFIIKKPQKIHSRFRARKRLLEKKKGRHLGHGSRKGTRNARCSSKMLWMKRQRAMRRLLVRYKLSQKIDRKMYVLSHSHHTLQSVRKFAMRRYHRYYLRAKGNAFKNKANLIERINGELSDKARNQRLLEQYKVRREEALERKVAKEKRKQKFLDAQLKLAEEAENIRLQQEAQEKAEKEAAAKKARQAKLAKQQKQQKGKKVTKGQKGKKGGKKQQQKESMDVDEDAPKKRRKRGAKKGKKEPEPEPEPQKAKRKRKRGKKKGGD